MVEKKITGKDCVHNAITSFYYEANEIAKNVRGWQRTISRKSWQFLFFAPQEVKAKVRSWRRFEISRATMH